MNLSELREAVRMRIGTDDGDNYFTDATLNSFINAALQQISTERNWPWQLEKATIAVVAGTTEYAVPADWKQTVRVESAFAELEHYQPSEDAKYRGIENNNPVAYYVERSLVHLIPTPNEPQDLDHYYIKVEPTLTGDTATPLLPAQYHDYLVVKAGVICATRVQNKDLRSLLRYEMQDWVNRMKDEQRTALAQLRLSVRNDWNLGNG